MTKLKEVTQRTVIVGSIILLEILSQLHIAASDSGAFAQSTDDIKASTITISRRDCQSFVRHHARNDVNYKAGVDVYGRPVKSADLNPSALKLPEEISITLNLDIFDFVGKTPPKGLGDSRATLGTVTFKNGRLYFNGEPLGEGIDPEIVKICEAYLKRK